MNQQRFCPDCGAPCGENDPRCPECQFPMTFNVIAYDDHIAVRGKDISAWNRVSQLMRRNGIRVQTKNAGNWSVLKAWWALPAIGFAFFLVTIFFGGALADMIWEPPPATPVVDLRDGNSSGNTNESTGNNSSNASDNDSANFLAEALRTSEDQQYQPENEVTFNTPDNSNRAILDVDGITAVMESACFDLAIGKRRRKGALMTEDGRFLTDLTIVDIAFRAENRTVRGQDSLRQRTDFIVPKATLKGFPERDTRLVLEGEDAELAVLRAPVKPKIDFFINFDDDLNISQEVWVAEYTLGRFFPLKASIVDTLGREGKALMYRLDSNLTVTSSGSPVLNVHGDVIGVLLVRNNENLVVSLYQMRDKSPLLFRELQ